MKQEKVAIVVIAYNEERYIEGCLKAILNQTFSDFHLIVVDDGSTDMTRNIIGQIKDPRLTYVKLKKRNGYATARNYGLKLIKEGIVFFTDADCRPCHDWIEKGLIVFKEKDPIAVGGLTQYKSKNNNPSIQSFLSIKQFTKPNFTTSNAAFRAEWLHRIGGFRQRYNDGWEDADVEIRVQAASGKKIAFTNEMVIVHLKKEYTIQRLFLKFKGIKQRVYYIKDHHVFLERYASHGLQPNIEFMNQIFIKTRFFWIMDPFCLLIIFCPPLLYFLLKKNNIRIANIKDFAYLPFVYGYMVVLRIAIWKAACQERFFVL